MQTTQTTTTKPLGQSPQQRRQQQAITAVVPIVDAMTTAMAFEPTFTTGCGRLRSLVQRKQRATPDIRAVTFVQALRPDPVCPGLAALSPQPVQRSDRNLDFKSVDGAFGSYNLTTPTLMTMISITTTASHPTSPAIRPPSPGKTLRSPRPIVPTSPSTHERTPNPAKIRL